MTTIIETDRLLLRPHSTIDFDDYTELWSSHSAKGVGISGTFLTPEESWARLLRFIGHWHHFDFGPFVVFDKATSSTVGEVGLAHFHRGNGVSFDPFPEAMWKIHSSHHGKGIGWEASQSVMNWFDERHTHNRTVCMISPDNLPSLRVATRLGFHRYSEILYNKRAVILFERISVREK